MNIEIINNNSCIRFHKKLWDASEIVLGKCFGFYQDIENGFMVANICQTSKRSIYEFIRIAFKSFSEAIAQEYNREKFYHELDLIYGSYNANVDFLMQKHLPYYNSLYNHQKDVIHEAYYKQYNFLALDMGLGKTLTSASLSRVHQIPRTLIVCPAAVKYNWFHDLKKFGFSELYFTMLDASKRRSFKAFNERFVIINYDILAKYEKEICSSTIGHIILDESHSLKNHLSLRAKNIRSIVEKFPDAKITFLSGTPITNRVNDVFSYLKMIGHELGHSHKLFIDNFTIKTSGRGGDRITGGKNLNDLHLKLSNFMIRRTKEQCLDLPEKVFLSYHFELDDYRADYNKIITELAEQKSISSLTGNIHSLNIITSKAKIKGIIELAESILETGKKVVIFGSYKDPLNTLEDYFKERCVKIDGSVPSFTRNELVQDFINNPEKTVFLGNMVAAGVGINLVNASDVIFLNFPLVTSELYQAQDRLHRIGQNNSVNIHYTFCEDSVDQHIHDLLIDKEKDIVAVIDKGKEVMERGDFIQVLISKLLNRKNDLTNIIPDSSGEASAPQEAVEAKQAPRFDKAEVSDSQLTTTGPVVQNKVLIAPPTFL